MLLYRHNAVSRKKSGLVAAECFLGVEVSNRSLLMLGLNDDHRSAGACTEHELQDKRTELIIRMSGHSLSLGQTRCPQVATAMLVQLLRNAT
jgi:hypothetical protein